MSTTTTTRAFIGEISKKGEGDGVKYFVKVSIPFGKGTQSKYQYCSLFANKNLNRVMASAFDSQATEEDGRVVNTLSAQLACVEIAELYFSVKTENEKTFLNGSGVLSSITFA